MEKQKINLPNGFIEIDTLKECLKTTTDWSKVGKIVVRNFEINTADDSWSDLEFDTLESATNYIKNHDTDRLRIMDMNGSIHYDFY